MRKRGWRNPVPVLTCEWCSKPIEDAYKGDQKYHRECAGPARREVDNARTKVTDDPQMERLFRGYKARNDIHITDRPNGTRVMMVSDHQIPFVDEAFVKAQMEFARDFRPHDLLFVGDVLDMYEISDFDKNPQRQFGIKTEIEQAESLFYDFGKRIAKDGRMWFAEGNHEERLRRYVWRHAGQLVDIIPDLDTLLHTEDHFSGTVPYGKAIHYLGFTATHGNVARQASGATAKWHADRYHGSGCNGHTHRCGSFSYTDGRGRSHTWFEIGCACRVDLEYVRGVANWQQGFLCGVVYNNAFHPELVRVLDYDDGTRGFTAQGKHYTV